MPPWSGVLSRQTVHPNPEDFFRGQVVNEITLAGLDHCIVCTAAQDKVHVRHYHIGFQRSGSKVGRVHATK